MKINEGVAERLTSKLLPPLIYNYVSMHDPNGESDVGNESDVGKEIIVNAGTKTRQ